LAVNVRNTGNRPTGGLTVALTGTGSGSFTLDKQTIDSLAVEGTAEFTVVPKTGLPAGTHTATVTVSGANGISAGFDVSFPATYGISLSQTAAHTFPDAILGYGAQAAKTVTITNTGNQPTGNLTLNVSNGNFTLTPASTIASIAAGGTAPFTVVPNTGLAVGIYTATVTVSGSNGISASFNVSFEVTVMAASNFAALVTHMNGAANSTSASYTLPGGLETYTSAITLTTANSPASVVIDGGGRVITGSTNRITVGSGITLKLKNITFSNIPFTVATGGKLVLGNEGDATGSAVVRQNAGAGVTVSGGTLEMKAGALVTLNSTSGIRVDGTSGVFTMDGGAISGNTATNGGGVLINGGSFTMNGGTISGNSAIGTTIDNNGGGVAVTGANSSFTMIGGKITGNTADNGGGVLVTGANSRFTMEGGEISGNTTAYFGGGVALNAANAVFTMNDGSINNNTAIWDGGGVVLWRDQNITFNMSGGVIKTNSTNRTGGGVYALYTSIFNMTGGEITGNTAGGYQGKPGIGGVVAPLVDGKIPGDPQIGGGTAPPTDKGWIHGNTTLDLSGA
jgi:hypothetical protein